MELKQNILFNSFLYGVQTALAHIPLIVYTILLYFIGFFVTLATGLLVNISLVKQLAEHFIKFFPQTGPKTVQSITVVSKELFNFQLWKQLFNQHSWGLTFAALFFFLYFIWVILSTVRISLDLIEDGESSARRVFDIFGYIPAAAVATILFFLLCAPAIGFSLFLGAAIGGLPFGLIPGVLLGAILAIWVAARFSLFYWFIIDRGDGVFQSLSHSFDITQGYGWYMAAWVTLNYLLHSIIGFSLFSAIVYWSIAFLGEAYLYRSLMHEHLEEEIEFEL